MLKRKSLLLLGIVLLSMNGFSQGNRSLDGRGNNPANLDWGAAEEPFRNYATNGFADSISQPGGQNRANPRDISNAIGSQSVFMANELDRSDFVWGWGQFIDHDVNLNEDDLDDTLAIMVPPCDSLFDPMCSGTVKIPMFRSVSEPGTGTSLANPLRHVNAITSFIDGSTVYGSSQDRADWLRSYQDGKLKTSAGNLLPWNTIDGEWGSAIDTAAPFMLIDGHPKPTQFFVGGDVRINEQPGLVAFHTLWVREHNRLCDELKAAHPTWSDEELFQRARKMVGALIQVVTYREFLPAIGVDMPAYNGYDNTVDPHIMNSFSAAAYRFGHTMVNGNLIRYEEDGTEWSFGAVDLRDAFFKPEMLKDEGGISPFFRGMAAQKHQFVDPLIMDDIRNFLFGPPGAGGLDLLAINLQRARERGLPDYNTLRTDIGLAPHASFANVTSDPSLQAKLATAYTQVDNIDPWIGFMSEDHLPGKIVGEGLNTILGMQFGFLRDGDRYYYENDPAFSPQEIAELESTLLSDVILRNTAIDTIQDSVFNAVPRSQITVELLPFKGVRNMQLTAYPNPVQKYFQLNIEAYRSSEARLIIYDLNGNLVREEAVRLQRGKNQFEFELSDQLANGLYTIVLRSESGQGQLKLVKQN